MKENWPMRPGTKNVLSNKVMPMPMPKLRQTKGTKKLAIIMSSDPESEEEVVSARWVTRRDCQVHFPAEASSLAQLRGTQGSLARLLVARKRKQVSMLSYSIKLPFNNYIIDKHNDDAVTNANIVADVDTIAGGDLKTKLIHALLQIN